MSTKGAQFLHLACQGGRLAPLLPVSYATVRERTQNWAGIFKGLDHYSYEVCHSFIFISKKSKEHHTLTIISLLSKNWKFLFFSNTVNKRMDLWNIFLSYNLVNFRGLLDIFKTILSLTFVKQAWGSWSMKLHKAAYWGWCKVVSPSQ